jgi:hypothetical protein
MNLSNIWNEFSAIRCINLLHRKDRLESVQNEMKNLHDIPIRFYFAHKHKEGGKKGCFESHMNVMKEHCNDKNCLIFEDDFQISKKFSFKYLKEVCRFMRSNNDWDIIYLGCFPDIFLKSPKNVYGNIYKVWATCTHAYIASHKFMNYFVENEIYDGSTPIDEVFRKYNTFAILPSLFKQSLSETDVSSFPIELSTFQYKHIIEDIVENYAMNFEGLSLKKIIALSWILFIIYFLFAKHNNKNKYGIFKIR